jgi:triacylglycerol lipase
MQIRTYIICSTALCAVLSSTMVVFFAGIAAACAGSGGGGGCPAPSVSTGSATSVTSNSVTLNGTVNPQGCVTTYTFEYGRTSESGYPDSITSSAGSGTSPVSVSTSSAIVQPGTNYRFRLSASNSGGTTPGGTSYFTTTAACSAPTVTTEAASSVTASTARLNGRINPNGCTTTYTFEYGLAGSGTYTKVNGSPGSGTEPVSVWNTISNLQSDKMYTFRLSASNTKGNSGGSFLYFTTAHDPILFVHGWNGDVQTFATFDNWFQQAGWPISRLYLWSYDSSRSNVLTAQEVGSKVDLLLKATGASKVDIVTHSMGALSSRYYLKNLGGTTKVEDWVSLGGPNHGTNTAEFCFSDACKQMWIGSSFLSELNAGDETPGGVRYRTWWSGCDITINPDSSVWLSGAYANTRATSCPSHSGLHEDQAVFSEVRDFVK